MKPIETYLITEDNPGAARFSASADEIAAWYDQLEDVSSRAERAAGEADEAELLFPSADGSDDHRESFRILHVDDEADIRAIVEMALKLDSHFITRHVNSGKEGLAVAAEWRPDIILLDVMMPSMDGPATLARLRADERTKHIPVVFLTARARVNDLERLNALEAMGVIEKPFDPLTLAAVVRSYLAATQHESRRERNGKSIIVLLVEDSPGDIRLLQEAFLDAGGRISLHVASDGVDAMKFLKHEDDYAASVRPDLILLDLNLPKMDGREVLARIKQDASLKLIPTVILTTSDAETDILKSYQLHANGYLTKPVELDAFEALVRSIREFWMNVKTPRTEKREALGDIQVLSPVNQGDTTKSPLRFQS